MPWAGHTTQNWKSTLEIGLRNSLLFLLCAAAAAGAFWPILGKTPFNPRSEGGMGVGVGKGVPVIDKSGFSPQNPDFMGKIRVGVGEGVPVIDPLSKVEVKFISPFTCKTKWKLDINISINGCQLNYLVIYYSVFFLFWEENSIGLIGYLKQKNGSLRLWPN